MKKLIILLLLGFSFVAHAQNNSVKIGNWDASEITLSSGVSLSFIVLPSNEETSLTPQQEKQKTDLYVLCDENNALNVFFMWPKAMFPKDYQLKEVHALLKWGSKKSDGMILFADPEGLYFSEEVIPIILNDLAKNKTLTLQIQDTKNKWNLVSTFKLDNASKALAIPMNACKK